MGELSTLSFVVSGRERAYTGVELRPHFLLQELGLRGSGIGVFQGPCQVRTEHLVDWEDRLATDPAHARIESKRMLHFIGEFFGMSLNEGVLTQRFLMATMVDVLNESAALGEKFRVRRGGDDLFSDGRKLSVSIVTASPVSVLLHAGLNIDAAGAPVPAIGLCEMGLNERGVTELVTRIQERFLEEWNDMKWACTKVRPVV